MECTKEKHDEIKRNESLWLQLAPLDSQKLRSGHILELRNCTCGSTLGLKRAA